MAPDKPRVLHLHVRSHAQLGTSAVAVPELVERARAMGYGALPLADVNTMRLAMPFYKACLAADIRPVLGVEIQHRTGRAVLLARDRAGYAACCAVVSALNLSEPKHESQWEFARQRRDQEKALGTATVPEDPIDDEYLDPDYHQVAPSVAALARGVAGRAGNESAPFDVVPTIAEHQEGLFVLTSDPALATRLRSVLDPGRLWLALERPGVSRMDELALWSTGKRLGLPVAASGCVTMMSPDDEPFLRTLAAIRDNELRDKLPPEAMPAAGRWFRPPEALRALFRDVPEALDHARLIVDACHCHLDLRRPVWPRCPLPGGQSAEAYLHKRCGEAMETLYPPSMGEETRATARRRFAMEMEVITRTGLCEYFVIVADLVDFAKAQRTPVVGRGSGASSIVAYLLGFTNVCPVRYGLVFERFLNDARDDLPDMDIDFCWKARDAVINHAFETYGRDHVAMVANHNCFHARSAFREVAKTYGVPTEKLNRYARLIPSRPDVPLRTALQDGPARRHIPLDEDPFPAIVAQAERMEGFPLALGTHCGGIVISDRPMTWYTPMQWATKGVIVSEFDKRGVEDIGLVKIDLLGNRALSIMAECLALVEQRTGSAPELPSIPTADATTQDLLQQGLTLGCFQIESPGMRNLLTQIGTRDQDGTILAHSLIRPGPAAGGMKTAYVKRYRQLETVTHLHPSLAESYRDTFGVMIYDEDQMTAFATLAGWTLTQADQARQAINKQRPERLAIIRDDFLRCVKARQGVDDAEALRLWEFLSKFGGYTFCKAHASGYGVIAYQSAYLKAHYPYEYTQGVLNNHVAMYPQRVHIEEAKRRGLRFALPCVNRSGLEYSIEDVPERASNVSSGNHVLPPESLANFESDNVHSSVVPRTHVRGSLNSFIRVGLARIEGVSETTLEMLLKERALRPFVSLSDFLSRVPCRRAEAEAMVLCGAFDFTGRSRPQLVWELAANFENAKHLVRERRDKPPVLFGNAVMVSQGEPPQLPDFTLPQKLAYEFDYLHLSVREHPMAYIRPGLRRVPRLVQTAELASYVGKGEITLAGIWAAGRRVRTKSGQTMQFLTLEDETGLAEVTLFPRVYQEYGGVFTSLGPYLATGTAEDQFGAVTLTANRVMLHHTDAVKYLPESLVPEMLNDRPEASSRANSNDLGI